VAEWSKTETEPQRDRNRKSVLTAAAAAARSGFQREGHGGRRLRGGALPRAGGVAAAPAYHRVAHDAARHTNIKQTNNLGIRFDATTTTTTTIIIQFSFFI
jgi:hypothetical protein